MLKKYLFLMIMVTCAPPLSLAFREGVTTPNELQDQEENNGNG